MERLSGIDATFLYLETPSSHMHVAMTGIYQADTMPGGYDFERVKAHIQERLPLVPMFTRRLVEVPFSLHHPVWVEDPHFDIDYHVRRIGCPSPGGRRELAEVAAQIASVPLDRKRPLWEIWVIENLKQNRFGFVAKVHHSAIDGASGAEIMTALYDIDPSGRELEPIEEKVEERLPSDVELIGYGLASRARRFTRTFGLLGRTAQSVANVVRNRRSEEGEVGAAPLTAPPTPWNGAITPHRRVSFARIPLDEAKELKAAYGVKVNDVVLAVVSGTLRRYLSRHGGVPHDPLVAVCPVSVRTEEEAGTGGNKVSAMFVSLASDIDDPVERMETIVRSTKGAKTEHNALGARMLTEWGEYASPAVFGLASRLYSSMGLADRHRPIHNLVISNVPGPPFPLYLAGAEMVAAYPMGPIMEGAGLNVTVLSYKNHIDFGFMACRELMPDLWDLADDVDAAFEELKQGAARLAAAKEAASNTPAPAKKVAAKKVAAKKAPAKKAPAKKAPAKKAPAKKAPAKKAPAKKAPAPEPAAVEA